MALSRRGWNNVIIYSVLAMLALFYVVPEYLLLQRQKDLTSLKLVPDGYVLVQLQFDRTNVQQAGPDWRFQPRVDETLQAAELAELWQQTELKPWPKQVELSARPLRRVGVLLAGDHAVQQWGLYQNGPDFYLRKQGFVEIFRVTSEQAGRLIPESLSKVTE